MGFFGRKQKTVLHEDVVIKNDRGDVDDADATDIKNKVADGGTGTRDGTGTDDDLLLTMMKHTNNKYEYVELGTINYVNVTNDGKHGSYDPQVLQDLAKSTGKPLFVNFVEWSG